MEIRVDVGATNTRQSEERKALSWWHVCMHSPIDEQRSVRNYSGEKWSFELPISNSVK